jgi:hypothetical protein
MIVRGVPGRLVLLVVVIVLSILALFLFPSSMAGVLGVLYAVLDVVLIALGAR